MYKWITRLLPAASGHNCGGDEPEPAKQSSNYFYLVEQARQEWQDAKGRFNEVSDPDLVDYAVYALEAAERRYIYLLRKARQNGAGLTGWAD